MLKTNYFNSFKGKFQKDVLWNIVFFVLIGIFGIALNFIIAKVRGKEVLGTFNTVYALYILFSQIAIFGVHLSVQKYIPQEEINSKGKKRKEIIYSGILLAFLFSIVTCFILYWIRDIPGKLLSSKNVESSFQYVIPALIFFSINKVFFSFFNGIREMKVFAFFQFLRSSLIIIFTILILFFSLDSKYLPLNFLLAELFLSPILLGYSQRFLKRNREPLWLNIKKNGWVFSHINFGKKVFLGNLMFDLNTRVDVLILNYLTDDASVGLYTLAATVAEGFLLLASILRNNINPIITRINEFANRRRVSILLQNNITSFYKFLSPLALISILIFPILLYILDVNDLRTVSYLYAVYVLGTFFSAGYLPFQLIFTQGGKPEYQTMFMGLVLFTNVLLDFLFISYLGVLGASLAVAFTLVLQIFYMIKLAKKSLNIELWGYR